MNELVWPVVLIAGLLLFGGWIIFRMLRTDAVGVESPASVLALVTLGVLALETMAAAVLASNYETLACDDAPNEPAWTTLVILLALATPILVPISIGFIWVCAVRHDRAPLLWIVVLFGSVIPLLVFIVTAPYCPS